jgi:hypothetical protein
MKTPSFTIQTNQSGIDIAIWRPLLRRAARQVELPAGRPVVIRISRRSTAGRCDALRDARIRLSPRRDAGQDYLDAAVAFYGVICHEFAHVADRRNGRAFGDYDRRWENRPHERRAMHHEAEAIEKLTPAAQDEILSLALAWQAADTATAERKATAAKAKPAPIRPGRVERDERGRYYLWLKASNGQLVKVEDDRDGYGGGMLYAPAGYSFDDEECHCWGYGDRRDAKDAPLTACDCEECRAAAGESNNPQENPCN